MELFSFLSLLIVVVLSFFANHVQSAQLVRLTRRFGIKSPMISTTALFMSHPAAGSPKKGEIRVRLLEDLKKTGKKGDLVFVSSTQYLNVLAPKKTAEKVSDEEMARILKDAADSSAAELAAAQDMQLKIKALPVLTIKKKVGDGNKLFGSITNKHVLDLVKSQFPGDASAALNAKPVTITEIKGDTPDLEVTATGEVRKAGTYTATLKLHSKVDVTLKFSVIPE